MQEKTSKDFLRTIIEEDIRTNKYGGKVITRFPPEPNGFPHIGHAKSICLNFGIAKDYNGVCHLRMDDTNPTTEDLKYVEAIKDNIKWLGFDWNDNLFFASDYFDRLYDYAIRFIKLGKAYVCSLSEKEIREYRGTVTQPGKESPYRNRSVEENLDLFTGMKAGKFKNGEHVLRAKIDMTNSNMKMRDPLIYRIRHTNHYRTGNKWCIYPMYDFAHCLSDYIEGITHSICTLEFENNRELYDWILDEMELELPRPYQFEFARLNLNYTVMSKRRLLELVENNYVNGWDDPRLPTLAGIRRRGYTPESLKTFCESIGIAKSNSTVDFAQLEFCIRNDLNQKVPRVLCVLNPLKIIIENYPNNKTEMLNASYFPHDVPLEGTRKVPFSKVLYIEKEDFMENPPKGYYRLSLGQEVRLRHAYIIKCEKIIKDEKTGEILELRCSYIPESKSGEDISGKKVKGTIHWVSAEHAKQVEVRIYDRLYNIESPDGPEDLNSNSLTILNNCFIEPAVMEEKPDERLQFERQGYFYIDPIDSTSEKPVFNRIVPLKDSWTKTNKSSKHKEELKKEPAQPKIQEQKQEIIAISPQIQERIENYQNKYDLNSEVAAILAKDENLTRYFEDILKIYNNPISAGNWVANEISREIKDKNINTLNFNPSQLAELIELVDNNTISVKIARNVFVQMKEKGGSPKQIIEAKGLVQISNTSELEPIIDKIIANNPNNVSMYKEGKTNLLGFFVGQVMKQTGGKANPKLVSDLIAEKLNP